LLRRFLVREDTGFLGAITAVARIVDERSCHVCPSALNRRAAIYGGGGGLGGLGGGGFGFDMLRLVQKLKYRQREEERRRNDGNANRRQ
jgi:hypothetical protein